MLCYISSLFLVTCGAQRCRSGCRNLHQCDESVVHNTGGATLKHVLFGIFHVSQAMCSFRPLSEISNFLQTVPELRALFDEASVQRFVDVVSAPESTENEKKVLSCGNHVV